MAMCINNGDLYNNGKISEMKTEIQDLKNSPTKTKAQWVDNIGRLVITSIVTGIVAFLLGNCFPQIFG